MRREPERNDSDFFFHCTVETDEWEQRAGLASRHGKKWKV